MGKKGVSYTIGLALGVLTILFVLNVQNVQSQAYGRIAFYAQSANSFLDDGTQNPYQELATSISFQSGEIENGFEYAADFRLAGYPSEDDVTRRISIYNAYVGGKFKDGRLGARVGQMWLNELGALGSIGGFLGQIKSSKKSYGQFRLGGFAGLEPESLDAGYVNNVFKSGGYLALDGENGRSHVVGYVNVTNSGKMERSVFVLTNFLPIGSDFFLYQAAEIDAYGIDRESLGLNYFFTNGRYTIKRKFEIQGLFNHGRSIDFRTLTLDQINGRPISDKDTRGFLFESIEGRVTYLAAPGLRFYVGYGQDQSNEGEDKTGRLSSGFYSSDLFHTGVDAQLSVSRRNRNDGSSYNVWTVSAGRMVIQKLYVSGEYTSSLSIVKFTGNDNVVVITRPSSNRYSLSSMFYWTRALTLLLTVERTNADSVYENRLLGGITYRF
jgi:hypothetical protein